MATRDGGRDAPLPPHQTPAPLGLGDGARLRRHVAHALHLLLAPEGVGRDHPGARQLAPTTFAAVVVDPMAVNALATPPRRQKPALKGEYTTVPSALPTPYRTWCPVLSPEPDWADATPLWPSTTRASRTAPTCFIACPPSGFHPSGDHCALSRGAGRASASPGRERARRTETSVESSS